MFLGLVAYILRPYIDDWYKKRDAQSKKLDDLQRKVDNLEHKNDYQHKDSNNSPWDGS